jgi:hypothetical protein
LAGVKFCGFGLKVHQNIWRFFYFGGHQSNANKFWRLLQTCVKWCKDGRTFVTYSSDLTTVTRWTVHGDSVPEDSNPVLFEGNSKYFIIPLFL